MRMTKTNRYLLVLTALLLVACHSGKENEDVQQNMEMHQQEDWRHMWIRWYFTRHSSTSR